MDRYKKIWTGRRDFSHLYDSGESAIPRVLPFRCVHRFSLSGMRAYPCHGISAYRQDVAGMGDESGYFPNRCNCIVFCGQPVSARKAGERD